jgi:hypothetical protein
MKRIELLLQELGPWGIAAIGVLLFCVAFEAGALRPAEQEVAALRLSVERRGALQAAAAPADGGSRRFYELFPPIERLPDELERLYGLAQAAGVDLPRADYRLDAQDGPLAAYRVTLPLRGPYPRVRAFISAALEAMPAAALEALLLERRRAEDTAIDAQLRLTLYFRAATAPGAP